MNSFIALPHVVVALSTYNGGRYLIPLLDSLLHQDYENFLVIIRDDGSTDSTIKIINDYCHRYPKRFVIDKSICANVGVTRSFMNLVQRIDDDSCLMFCDQDDVWFRNKISTFVNRLLDYMRGVQNNYPVLVYGDMIVTDDNLDVIADSFWKYQKLDLDVAHDWRCVMMSNIVTGCSSLLNPSAVSQFKKAPDLPILHDHLAAILIAQHGVLIPLAKSTMFYRQHNSNIEGARAFGSYYLIKRLGFFFRAVAPKYIVLCRTFDIPLYVAACLKIRSIYRRLRN